MSLLTNFQDLANTVKLALDRKADKSELATKADKSEIPTAGQIAQGDTGYATGGDVYTELQNIPSMPSGTNNGDILVWNGDEWVSKPKWQMIYQPVEWIRSSGVCYFNTGYYPQTNDVFTIDYQLDSWSSSGEFKYDGNTLVTFSDVLQTPSYEMRILASNQGGYSPSQNNCLHGFFYGQGVKNGGTIIRNYIPVYNIYTGEVGIFDTANLVFISKSGSGTLTHGNDVN